MTQPCNIERAPVPITGGQLESFPAWGFGPLLASFGVYLTRSEDEIHGQGDGYLKDCRTRDRCQPRHFLWISLPKASSRVQ